MVPPNKLEKLAPRYRPRGKELFASASLGGTRSTTPLAPGSRLDFVWMPARALFSDGG
jgi:hypothetical protein